jgi:hypothetical protein
MLAGVVDGAMQATARQGIGKNPPPAVGNDR